MRGRLHHGQVAEETCSPRQRPTVLLCHSASLAVPHQGDLDHAQAQCQQAHKSTSQRRWERARSAAGWAAGLFAGSSAGLGSIPTEPDSWPSLALLSLAQSTAATLATTMTRPAEPVARPMANHTQRQWRPIPHYSDISDAEDEPPHSVSRFHSTKKHDIKYAKFLIPSRRVVACQFLQ